MGWGGEKIRSDQVRSVLKLHLMSSLVTVGPYAWRQGGESSVHRETVWDLAGPCETL